LRVAGRESQARRQSTEFSYACRNDLIHASGETDLNGKEVLSVLFTDNIFFVGKSEKTVLCKAYGSLVMAVQARARGVKNIFSHPFYGFFPVGVV
jgi:hypothetical protein